MKKYEQKEVSQKILVSVLCNMCEKETITESSPGGNGVHIRYEGGYDSEVIGDGTRLDLDLCEVCLNVLRGNCKIPPTMIEIGVGLD